MKRARKTNKEKTFKKRSPFAHRRTKKVKWRSLLWNLFPWKPIFGILAVLIFLVWWVRYDPAGWFRLSHIRVSGPTEHLGIEEIEELAAPTFGIPLMLLDLNAIQSRIENHRWVRTAKLRRLLPDTLYIHVQEHIPAAILELPKKFLVSSDGIVFKKLEKDDPQDFTIISGLKKDTIENHLFRQRILESLAVIHKIKTTGSLELFGLQEVHWKDERFLSLVTQKPSFRIVLGEAPWKDKLDRLIHVLPFVEKDGRVPTRIALNTSKGIIVRYAKKEVIGDR